MEYIIKPFLCLASSRQLPSFSRSRYFSDRWQPAAAGRGSLGRF